MHAPVKPTMKTVLATTLTLVIMISIAPAGPTSASAAAVGSSGGNAAPAGGGRKEYPVRKIREMVRELLKKQKLALWERMLESQGTAHHESAGHKGAEHSSRLRRAAAEEDGETEAERILTFEQEDTLTTFLSEVISCHDIPGLSLGLVKNGVRQAKGFGLANMETAHPMDGHTLMGIGSNTKAFAAATMAKVMSGQPADKKFYFSTPLSELLEDFQLPDDTRTRLITLQDVLSHRSGLGSADLGIFAGYPANFTAKDMCRRLQFLPEMVSFRSDWYYSNTMLVLVAHLCETVTGNTWGELVTDLIFRPLGMNASVLLPEALSLENVALPYIMRMTVEDMFVQQDEKLFDIHPLEAAGAIMASANDMTKWLAYLLEVINRPRGSDMVLLRKIFHEHILMPPYLRHLAVLQEPEPVLHVGYGMGFITSFYKNQPLYWHTGDNHGYASIMMVVPKMETAVYVAVNGPSKSSTSKAVQHIAYYVLELLQGHTPWVNVTLACPEDSAVDYDYEEDAYDYDDDYPGDDAQEVEVTAQKLLRPIEDYLGVYGHGLLGDLAIVREEDRNSLLRLELGRHLVADLIPTEHESVFTLAARTPVADTKEWEKEQTITFWPIGISATTTTTTAKNANADANTTTTTASPTKSGEEEEGGEKEGQKEEEQQKKAPFDEIRFRWELETYSFKKSVRFASALEGRFPSALEDDSPSDDGSVHQVAPSIGGNGAARVGDASCLLASMLAIIGFLVSVHRLR